MHPTQVREPSTGQVGAPFGANPQSLSFYAASRSVNHGNPSTEARMTEGEDLAVTVATLECHCRRRHCPARFADGASTGSPPQRGARRGRQ